MRVAEGVFADGSGWMRTGQGPALVLSLGFTPAHGPLRGPWRQLTLRTMAAFAPDFTVWAITRPPGASSDADMSWFGHSLMRNIREIQAGEVAVVGHSTGGSVALQAAIDYPQEIERLIVADGAARLTDWGRAAQGRLADDLEEGRQFRGWLRFLQATGGWGPGALTAALGCVLPGGLLTDDTHDAVCTLRAENVFDAERHLGRVGARTLVIGGSEDRLYSPVLMQHTAAAIPAGRLEIVPGAGHGVGLSARGHQLIRHFLGVHR